MGWKNLKEKFGIKHHVQVTEAGICIGSGYVHDLVTVDPATGCIRENQTFSSFLRESYPALLEAPAEEIVRLIATPDTFAASVPVYTYAGGEIVEKQCEAPGWPNVTHDGCMMYENSFSTDKSLVVRWAKRSAAIASEHTRNRIAEAEAELVKLKARLADYEAERAKLDADYPDTAPAE